MLKHESIRCNDYIEALFWKKYEMMAYSQSLMCKDYSSDRKSCYKIKQKSILTEIFCPLSTFKILYYIFTKRGGEKVLLHLNKCSNDYGSNWVRGVCFTIWMSIVFYSLFFITTDNVVWGWFNYRQWLLLDCKFWAGFTNYLWLPDGFEELTKNNSVNGGFIGWCVFIIGKVLIAYGIYQTISAFRKYGK